MFVLVLEIGPTLLLPLPFTPDKDEEFPPVADEVECAPDLEDEELVLLLALLLVDVLLGLLGVLGAVQHPPPRRGFEGSSGNRK